ncbi:MAG: hypothetical protein ACLQU4_16000 [Limisphaerales bacterium]
MAVIVLAANMPSSVVLTGESIEAFGTSARDASLFAVSARGLACPRCPDGKSFDSSLDADGRESTAAFRDSCPDGLAMGICACVATASSFEFPVEGLGWPHSTADKSFVSPADVEARKSTVAFGDIWSDGLAIGIGACVATTGLFEFSVKPLTWTPCPTGRFFVPPADADTRESTVAFRKV